MKAEITNPKAGSGWTIGEKCFWPFLYLFWQLWYWWVPTFRISILVILSVWRLLSWERFSGFSLNNWATLFLFSATAFNAIFFLSIALKFAVLTTSLAAKNYTLKKPGKSGISNTYRPPVSFVFFGDRIGLDQSFWCNRSCFGLIAALISLLWCTVLPAGTLTWLYWIEVVFSILIVIVAAAAMATIPKWQKPQAPSLFAVFFC